jgi:hypothetical protein
MKTKVTTVSSKTELIVLNLVAKGGSPAKLSGKNLKLQKAPYKPTAGTFYEKPVLTIPSNWLAGR